MNDAFGIINFEDQGIRIEGLMDYRPVSAISFLGRYRVIDFVLSNMVNSGIDQIQVYFKEKPRSLIEHLGNGRHYNINSKRGWLHLLGMESTIHSEVYNHDVNTFTQNLHLIQDINKPYVVIAPSYMVYSLDYSQVLKAHLENNADVTVVYKNVDNANEAFSGCDTLSFDGSKRITRMEPNRGKYKIRNISLECYVMSKKMLIELVQLAAKTSSLFRLKDMIADVLSEYNIIGYRFSGYVACLNSLSAYYNASMELISYPKAKELFKSDWPIYTRTNDSPPTVYGEGGQVEGSMVSNGCLIEGSVIHSVIGRNVVIKQGAVIKDSVLLPGCFIGKKVALNKVIVDKKALIHHIKKLEGTSTEPVYVKNRDRI